MYTLITFETFFFGNLRCIFPSRIDLARFDFSYRISDAVFTWKPVFEGNVELPKD